MKISPREVALGLTTLMVSLFGGTAIVAKPKIAEWKELRMEEAGILQQIEQHKRLAGQRDQWTGRLQEVRDMLPQYPADGKMDVHWLSTMDRLASRHGVRILKHEPGEEKLEGDVYEMPIECRDWEGSLEAIVHFLFDLQSEGAMLDIRQLLIKPKGKNLLRGRFLLYCAYTRDAGAE